MSEANEVVRIAALGDVHCSKQPQESLQPLFQAIADAADICVLCGDLTDYGLAEEAKILMDQISHPFRIPLIAVLGNHDYEAGQQDAIREVLIKAGAIVLDGESCEVKGIGFAGIKGFAGGFGRGALGFWGEPAIKAFVQETLNESLKLESALARLRTRRKIVVMHYSPILGTVEGEPPEIFPYLGCSRLEEPLSRYPVTLVLHGHAHKGSPEGKTVGGVPVYNVSLPLLRKLNPDQPPFRLIEIPLASEPEESHEEANGQPAKRRAARAAS
jgi:Icc-related predicted phosphoesterase